MGYEIGITEDPTGEKVPPIEQGSTFWLEFTMTNIFTDGGASAVLTGQYRPTLAGADKTDMVGTILAVTPELLTCRLSIAADITATMIPGKGFWDCEITGVVDDDLAFVIKPLGSGNRAIVKAEASR